MPGLRSVALGVWIGVGSRYERPQESGVSHFIEHLLFKGTPTRSAAQIAQVFDGLGGEINAATGRDSTLVYTRVLDAHVDEAFEVMADMVQRPSLHDLDQEREVVIEEIAMYEDDPDDLVHDLAATALYPDQPLGRPVIGTAEVVGSVSRDAILSYHGHHYCAPNVVVAAAGNLDHDQLVGLAERLLTELPVANGAPDVVPPRPTSPRLLVRERPTEQYHLCLAGPGISRDDERRHAHALLDSILGGSMSSRLFQEIREVRGLAYSVGSYTVGYKDGGQVGVFVGTRGDNLGLACEVIATELKRIGDEPVAPDELRRAKEHLKGRVVLGLESPGTRMNRVGRATLTGSELLAIDDLIERIEVVSASDIQALAAEFWSPERLCAAAIGPSRALVEAATAKLSPALSAVA